MPITLRRRSAAPWEDPAGDSHAVLAGDESDHDLPVVATAVLAAIGVGATAVMDLWAAALRRIGVPSLDFALLGRWVGHLPDGRWMHDSIGDGSKEGAWSPRSLCTARPMQVDCVCSEAPSATALRHVERQGPRGPLA